MVVDTSRLDEFLPLHALRAPTIAWFLGAGASAAAGIPTAFDMVLDFKRTLYCAAQRVPVETVADLGDSTVRARLQRHFDDSGGFPAPGSDAEYAQFFEAAYPDEADRRHYIETHLSGGSPSYGHYALAALMQADKVRVVWTTNFDAMVEDAVAQVFKTTSKLSTATLDSPAIAGQAMNEGRWPLLGKLHGDFRSQQLKNIPSELRAQEAVLRATLIESCRRFGLAVVGYSGRDVSVMESLTEALDNGKGYPQGLYWFQRGDAAPLESVQRLLAEASRLNVKAALISCETFDELMGDLLVLESGLEPEVRSLLDSKRKTRFTSAPLPTAGTAFPVIRTNALPVVAWPQTARLVECEIGGSREVREAVEQTGADVIAARRQAGVVAFGSDEEMRKAFAGHKIQQLGLYSIEKQRLGYWDSVELGLLSEAISRALVRDLPLVGHRRGPRHRIAVEPSQANDTALKPLRDVAKQMSGTIAGSGRGWAEAVEVRLDYRLDQVWLLLEPTVWVEQSNESPLDATAKEFIRNRLADRYNRTWNALIDAWRDVLLGGDQSKEIRAFAIGDGIDAVFTVGPTTTWSRRSAA